MFICVWVCGGGSTDAMWEYLGRTLEAFGPPKAMGAEGNSFRHHQG